MKRQLDPKTLRAVVRQLRAKVLWHRRQGGEWSFARASVLEGFADDLLHEAQAIELGSKPKPRKPSKGNRGRR